MEGDRGGGLWEKLAVAVETVAAFVPVIDDDAVIEWRAELVKRYRTVQGFIELLLEVIRFRWAGRPRTRGMLSATRSRGAIYPTLRNKTLSSNLLAIYGGTQE